ncbi:MAG: daunorubicin ABC transporter ATP-binding protein [Thermoplasmatales archaeon B_DKE]|nr:MAG: daunorubicin ABC transporter ATP-binding protein [Thermoplasmatales archaeon B_DKE]
MNPKFSLYFAWYYGFRVIGRGSSYVIASIATPLTLLFLVFVLSRGELVEYAIIGGFVSLIASNGLTSASDAAFLRLQAKIQDLFIATSINSIDYMIGLTLSFLLFTTPGIVLYAGLSLAYHLFTIERILVLIGVLFMLALSTSAISFIIAGAIKHIRNVWGIVGILSIIMTILPPTYYPYTFLPKYVIYILAISPATPAAIILQGSFGLSPEFLAMIVVLFAETAVYLSLAKYFTRWREK